MAGRRNESYNNSLPSDATNRPESGCSNFQFVPQSRYAGYNRPTLSTYNPMTGHYEHIGSIK